MRSPFARALRTGFVEDVVNQVIVFVFRFVVEGAENFGGDLDEEGLPKKGFSIPSGTCKVEKLIR